MINGMMMHCNLNIKSIMQHALTLYSQQEIVTLNTDGLTTHRYTYQDAFNRVAQFAHSLNRLNVSSNAIIGTIAWNNYQHFELHYSIPCSGRIYHTINPKLSSTQLVQIITSAKDEVLIIEPSFIGIIENIYEEIKLYVKHIIILGKERVELNTKFEYTFYEDLLSIEPTQYDWPDIPEESASGLCYTSGTTGEPKGVLYSHRSTVLHAMTLSMANVVGLSEKSCIMPLVPLYHISAWGMPFNAVLCGSKIVWPNSFAGDIEKVYNLIESEKVDISMAVPTIWSNLKNYLHEKNVSEIALRRAISGGSAASYTLIEGLSRYGISVENAWGMTETSSMGACNRTDNTEKSSETQALKCGRPIFGLQIRLRGNNNELLPHDGVSEGVLEIKGHSIVRQYLNTGHQTSSHDSLDLWFDTGDIATIDKYGYIHITDRVKDMIKTGGEWVSSVEIENAMQGHKKVAEVAVIAASHPKWGERPLLILVTKADSYIEHVEVEEYLSNKLHKWCIPSATILVKEMPYTGTGKISKKELRERYYNYFMQ